MSNVIIHGLPMSSYVRTVLMVCAYKNIPHQLQPLEPGSSEHLSLHPFGRVPAITHGELRLFETLAITSYLDRTFGGSDLLFEDVAENAIALQWISAINDYVYQNLILRCASERFVKPLFGKEPDEGAIAEALPTIRSNLDVLNSTLGKSKFLAGSRISLPDFFLAPIFRYFAATPEGQSEIPSRVHLVRWNESVENLPEYATINSIDG